jgi:hypothetical protein
LKFAYQDLSKQREIEEAKLKQSNPQKAEQIERLGMGFANRRYTPFFLPNISTKSIFFLVVLVIVQ